MPLPPPPDATTPVAVEFELTHDDMVDASIALARRSRAARVVSAGLLFGASAIVVGLPLAMGVDMTSSLGPALLGLLGFVGFQKIVVPRIQREQVSATLREGQNLFLAGRQHVVIDENGVTSTNWVMQTHVRWVGVERIVVTDQHLLLCYGGARGLIVPRRAFASEEAMKGFIASAERRRATALAAARPAAALPPARPGAGG